MPLTGDTMSADEPSPPVPTFEVPPRDGTHRTFHDESEHVELEGEFVDGLREGTWTWFYEDGQTHWEIEYEGGQLAYRRQWKDGQRHAENVEVYEHGLPRTSQPTQT